jgi:large subunit ribosomal protein L3
MIGLIGRKIGMTRMFHAESGEAVPVTVIHTGLNVVHQVKTEKNDGYSAVQVGLDIISAARLNKALTGHFRKLGTEPSRVVREIALETADEDVKPGQKIGVEIFENVKFIDVTGVSKGRGFAGPHKRHNFKFGRKSHGNTNYREPGSVGANTFPSRVFPGKRMAGHYGAGRVTVKRLELVGTDKEMGLIFVKGAIPGATKGLVLVRKYNVRGYKRQGKA